MTIWEIVAQVSALGIFLLLFLKFYTYYIVVDIDTGDIFVTELKVPYHLKIISLSSIDDFSFIEVNLETRVIQINDCKHTMLIKNGDLPHDI